MIATESDRLARIVNDILLAGQLDSGRFAIDDRPGRPTGGRSGRDRGAPDPRARGGRSARRTDVASRGPSPTADSFARCSTTCSRTRSSIPLASRESSFASRLTRPRSVRRPGPRSRHPRRRAAPNLREVLQARPVFDGRRRRHRARALHLPRARAPDGRPDLSVLAGRARFDVHGRLGCRGWTERLGARGCNRDAGQRGRASGRVR